jgi:hypothetical protein
MLTTSPATLSPPTPPPTMLPKSPAPPLPPPSAQSHPRLTPKSCDDVARERNSFKRALPRARAACVAASISKVALADSQLLNPGARLRTYLFGLLFLVVL